MCAKEVKTERNRKSRMCEEDNALQRCEREKKSPGRVDSEMTPQGVSPYEPW